jgi:hypothetical protein
MFFSVYVHVCVRESDQKGVGRKERKLEVGDLEILDDFPFSDE